MEIQELIKKYRKIKSSPSFSTESQNVSDRQAQEIKKEIEKAGYTIKESQLLGTYELERKK